MSTTSIAHELAGRVALVTGAGRGIGGSIARAVAARGAVAICADITGAGDTVEAITATGGVAEDRTLDVRSLTQWDALVDDVTDAHGGIDILANVAGVLATGSDTAVDLTEDEWERVISINLKGCWLGMRAVIPAMIERGGGRIVSLASVAALKGQPDIFAYSASKGGVVAMTQQAAVQYVDHEIFVNAIAPGVVDTPLLGEMSAERRAAYSDAHLIKRLATVDDVAEMFCYLVRPSTTFVTGHTFPLDGGATIK